MKIIARSMFNSNQTKNRVQILKLNMIITTWCR